LEKFRISWQLRRALFRQTFDFPAQQEPGFDEFSVLKHPQQEKGGGGADPCPEIRSFPA